MTFIKTGLLFAFLATIHDVEGTVTMTKANFADPFLEANQDRITDNVWLSRGDEGNLCNAVHDTCNAIGGINEMEPSDAEFADGTLASGDPSALTYQSFHNWHGGNGSGGPSSKVGVDAVMHLITDDIYLDFKLISWTKGDGFGVPGGGGFSYTRSCLCPEYTVEGDCNAEADCTWDGSNCQYVNCNDLSGDSTACDAASYCLFENSQCVPQCGDTPSDTVCMEQNNGSDMECEIAATAASSGAESICMYNAAILSEADCIANTQTKWCTGTPIGGGASRSICTTTLKYYPNPSDETWVCSS